MTIRRRTHRPTLLALSIAVLALVAAAGAPPAEAKVKIGFGQQTPQIFWSDDWLKLDTPYVRYITPWDVLDDPPQLHKLDVWMTAAREADARVMLGFQHSLQSRRAAKRLPSRREYADAIKGLRKRYPRVRDWVPWNETNHKSALTGKRPKRAAAYYNILKRQCRRCNVVAADVLDLPNMERWIKRYKRHLKFRPRIWGLHNYNDANRFTARSTRRLLKLVNGVIWFTETGGVVRMRVNTRDGVQTRRWGRRRAARATRHVLNLSRKSRRIRRIYIYHWLAPSRFTTWDSAVTNSKMKPRIGFRVLRHWLKKGRRRGWAF